MELCAVSAPWGRGFSIATQEEFAPARRRAEIQRHRDLMGEVLGVFDDQLLSVLELAGFTADAIGSVEFVPLVQIAWADGAVSNRQCDLIKDRHPGAHWSRDSGS